jgi:hypothetical protein
VRVVCSKEDSARLTTARGSNRPSNAVLELIIRVPHAFVSTVQSILTYSPVRHMTGDSRQGPEAPFPTSTISVVEVKIVS